MTAAATSVATMAEIGGNGGGVDAATVAGTNTAYKQLKAASEGRLRRRWR